MAMAILVITMASRDMAGQRPAVATDADDIGGVVTGPRGPEAGVWVIAETTNLPTKLIRIVVTDDQGRFLVPDLPKASYSVWARGYGLVDSSKTQAQPGQMLNLMAIPAANAKAAAEYYPAQYWLSLMRLPGAHDFPGTGPQGNGISPEHQEPGAVDRRRRSPPTRASRATRSATSSRARCRPRASAPSPHRAPDGNGGSSRGRRAGR